MNWIIPIIVLIFIFAVFGSVFTVILRLIGPVALPLLAGYLIYKFFIADKRSRTYTSSNYDDEDEFGTEEKKTTRRVYTDTTPKKETKHEHPEAANVASDERDIEDVSEIVDLPESALKKEE